MRVEMNGGGAQSVGVDVPQSCSMLHGSFGESNVILGDQGGWGMMGCIDVYCILKDYHAKHILVMEF